VVYVIQTAFEQQDQDGTAVPSWSCCCSKAVCKPVWHVSLLSVQWITPDDRQRNCPKHVEFHFQNKFEKSVHLVGFIIRKFLTLHVVANPLSPFLSSQSSFSSVSLYIFYFVWQAPIFSCSHLGFFFYEYVQSPLCSSSVLDSYVLSIRCIPLADLFWTVYTYTCSAWMCIITSTVTHSGRKTQTPYRSVELLLEALPIYISLK
jgi:hypothetical protein